MKEYKVEVETIIIVKVDESKFDKEFIDHFKQYFYDFEDIDEHIEHLAQLYSRGLADNNSFIEGYGDAKAFGISFEEDYISERIMDVKDIKNEF